VVSAAVLASRVLGLVREQVFAVFFGAGRELDAFITASASRTSSATSSRGRALRAPSSPRSPQHLVRDGERGRGELASLVVNALAIVVGLLTPSASGSRRRSSPDRAGFSGIPGKVELTVAADAHHVPVLLLHRARRGRAWAS
jgi:putative peptidoglycan lipid II flippase